MARKLLVAVIVVVLAGLLALGGEAGAQPPTIEVREVRGEPVVVNGQELRLWVFVHPAPKATSGASYCTDGDQNDTVPAFATANPKGLAFNINPSTIPSYLDASQVIAAIKASFAAWDNAGGTRAYFTVNGTDGAAGPAPDGINTVGWAYIVPTTVLAATWVWTDNKGVVQEADVFFNAFQKWGILSACNSPTNKAYDVQDVGTHEAGHTVGLDHLRDPNGYATMYPTASKGEVRKRTLTTGDRDGYTAAGGY
jgi:hypothetical protein